MFKVFTLSPPPGECFNSRISIPWRIIDRYNNLDESPENYSEKNQIDSIYIISLKWQNYGNGEHSGCSYKRQTLAIFMMIEIFYVLTV